MYFQLFYTKEVIDQLRIISIKINSQQIAESLALIENTFRQFDDQVAFDYSFLDSDIGYAYRQEEKFSEVLIMITILSIFIACLGTFGITTASTRQRKRELGIRKVLGASIFQIAFIINKNFLFLVLVANLIAFPIAYLINNYWLQNFALRVEIGVLTFVITLIITLLTTLIGSSFWSIKAATLNPVDAIKTE